MAPVAAKTYCATEDLGEDVIVCDAGGTTFDVGLVRDGGLIYTRDTWIGPQWTGDILAISSVDVRSIGAGGGSIAWIDPGGSLRVGPRSAGAEPGPVCYDAGGTLPTVTDCNLVLGYLDPNAKLAGRLAIRADKAEAAIGEHLAAPLGLSIDEAAAGVLAVESLDLAGSGKLVYFMAIEEAKFRTPVEPGCLLDLKVEFLQQRRTIYKFKGEASVDGKVTCQAEFTAMIADPPA